MTNKPVIAFASLLLGIALPGISLPSLAADGPEVKGPKQSFDVTNTERVKFLPGGAIHLENSYGSLTVEGWDEPEVELTVTKSTNRFYEPAQKGDAERRFDQIRVVTERRSDKELVIATVVQVNKNHFSHLGRIFVTRPDKLGITVDYKVLVPRDSRLVVHHDHGYVWVSDVTGDMDVDSHTGDMIVMLPDPGTYSIDARSRMGNVSSEFTGISHNQFLVGHQFTYQSQATSRRIIRLRMGCGSITVKKSPPSGPYEKN
jgi:hypothetical protein